MVVVLSACFHACVFGGLGMCMFVYVGLNMSRVFVVCMHEFLTVCSNMSVMHVK